MDCERLFILLKIMDEIYSSRNYCYSTDGTTCVSFSGTWITNVCDCFCSSELSLDLSSSLSNTLIWFLISRRWILLNNGSSRSLKTRKKRPNNSKESMVKRILWNTISVGRAIGSWMFFLHKMML
jgi:hypothetical protein